MSVVLFCGLLHSKLATAFVEFDVDFSAIFNLLEGLTAVVVQLLW